MVKSKTILVKNRRGNVVKIVREHYLRDDIPCSLPQCTSTCPAITPTNLKGISDRPQVTIDGKFAVFLCDFTVAMYQIDILEHPKVQDMILAYTVLDQVREKSPVVMNRLRACAADPSKHFHVFPNEYQKYSYFF
jgi:exosome complex exonuclease DIS3/RRP44